MKLDGRQQVQLRDIFAKIFSEPELRTLCLNLNLVLEDIQGNTRAEKIQELIAMMNRHGRVEELLKEAKEMRPLADWSAMVPAQASDLFPIHEIAYPKNPNFTGRVDLLEQIEQTLSSGQTAVVTQAISGLGGVGKTQLALAYCYTHLQEYDLIFWLAADNEASLTDSFRSLGQRLKLATAADTDQQAIVQRVLRWLGQAERQWLLVFDNADEIESKELANYLPRTGSGQILITSRSPNWRTIGNVLTLDIFSKEEAVDFLNQRTEKTTPENEAEKSLAATLGYFPLALEHAAAYVEATGSNYVSYQQLFEKMRQELWREVEVPNSYHATISTTWQLTFKQIQEVPGALDLLNLCCFLAPDDIPFDLIVKHAKALPEELSTLLEHPIERDKLVKGLLRYSLIQRKGDELSLHRLVQMVARDQMSKELSQKWVGAAISFLSVAFAYDKNDMKTWSTSQRLLNHSQTIVEWVPEDLVLPEKTVQLLNKTAEYLSQFGNYESSLVCTQKALAISEKQLGPNHPDTAQSLNNFGGLLQAMGDLARARPFYERALAIREKALGSDHPDTAQTLNNLGALLHSLGDMVAALPLYERALAIREKALGPDHPDTANSLNNLGSLLQAMGDLVAARQLHERALAISEKILGPDHPDTAASLNNLGSIYLFQGKLVLARKYLERALKIIEQTKGKNHPVLVKILTNLSGIMVKFRNDVIARQYLKRAQTICREAPVPYAECREVEELWKRLPGVVGKTKGKNKKRRR